MKVLHIASGSTGGARLAAQRLFSYQLKSGMEPEIFPKDDSEFIGDYKDMMVSKVYTASQRLLTKKQYGIFSSVSLSRINIAQIGFGNFEVIHIHNWFNIINQRDIIQLSKLSPLVFTLHDERLLTGGCHYTFDCENFERECTSCPGVLVGKNKVHQKKRELDQVFESIDNYGVISPSNWIKEKSEKQPILENSRITRVIPNLIEYSSNRKLNTWEEKKIRRITFIAANVDEDIKGFRLLVDALSRLEIDGDAIHLDVIGEKKKIESLRFSHTFHGYLKPEEVQDILANNGLCVIPSKLDNSPSTAIEAMLSGNILLVTNVGGLPELVIEKKTGFKCEPDVESLSVTLDSIFKLNPGQILEMRDSSLKRAHEIYDNSHNFRKHVSFYQELMSHV